MKRLIDVSKYKAAIVVCGKLLCCIANRHGAGSNLHHC